MCCNSYQYLKGSWVITCLTPQRKSYTQHERYCKSTNFGGSKIWRFSKYSDLAAIKFGVSPSMHCTINVRSRILAPQILAKTRNSPNSPNIIARQNLLIYSSHLDCLLENRSCIHNSCNMCRVMHC